MAEITVEKVKEYAALMWVNTVVSLRNSLDFFLTAGRYYQNKTFAKVDLSLIFSYLLNNPFAISKRFLMQHKATDIYAYGETPLASFAAIMKECGVTSKDVVYELGCGRGRTCFWLNAFVGCKVVGIEIIPEFVDKAQKIQQRFKLENLEFRCEDMLTASLSDATVIYLYGTCLEDDAIHTLEAQFAKLPAGTKIITVSYSLPEYAPEGRYEVMKRFPVPFTWGTGDVYLNVKKT